jgi:NAD(P)-dependent dehydrogenase (short-subunit alcohol dehydrogenase family)
MLLINGVTGEIGLSVLDLAISRQIRCIGIGRDQHKLSKLRIDYPDSFFYSIDDIANEETAKSILLNIANSPESITMYLHAAATLNRTKSPIETSLSEFRETVRVNLEGSFIWNKLVIEYMLANNIPGSILNFSSQAARTGGFGGNVAYAASKGAVETLTKSMSRFASKYGIRVNAIAPGFVNNSMMMDGITEDQKIFFENKTLFNRFAENSEIAGVCLFLLGPDASYITGEVIEVSAGQKIG